MPTKRPNNFLLAVAAVILDSTVRLYSVYYSSTVLGTTVVLTVDAMEDYGFWRNTAVVGKEVKMD